jgi:hypothetical protein
VKDLIQKLVPDKPVPDQLTPDQLDQLQQKAPKLPDVDLSDPQASPETLLDFLLTP